MGQLLVRGGSDVVLRVLADLEAQPAGTIRSPLGWLSAQVGKAGRGQHRHTAARAPDLVEREVYTDSQRDRAIGAGVPPGHFHRSSFDEANRPLWMYLPNGVRRPAAEPGGDGAGDVAGLRRLGDLAGSLLDRPDDTPEAGLPGVSADTPP
ncbi:hypothetical protein [Rubrivirga marina]|uniref:Uncharacterized protein n=1 Tax=Rubrivirga marina TaxID=1196024 RepID=A0A271J3B4_9BACT|nr:hypothetical protein [Rubrivirga marina]PAP78016.1 hypothetical protein BSZ37_17000 [Rubrivirga marina]